MVFISGGFIDRNYVRAPVETSDIKDEAVTRAKLAPRSVGSREQGTLTAARIVGTITNFDVGSMFVSLGSFGTIRAGLGRFRAVRAQGTISGAFADFGTYLGIETGTISLPNLTEGTLQTNRYAGSLYGPSLINLGGDAIGPGSLQVLDITADTEGTLGANRYAGSLYGPSLIDLGNSVGQGTIKANAVDRPEIAPDAIGSSELDAFEVAGGGLVSSGAGLNVGAGAGLVQRPDKMDVDLGGDAIGPGSIQVLDITADTEGTLNLPTRTLGTLQANRYAGSLYGPSLIDLGGGVIGPGSLNTHVTGRGTVEARYLVGTRVRWQGSSGTFETLLDGPGTLFTRTIGSPGAPGIGTTHAWDRHGSLQVGRIPGPRIVQGAGLISDGDQLAVDLGGDAIGPGSIQVLDITADTEGTLGANRYAGSLYGPSLIDLGGAIDTGSLVDRAITSAKVAGDAIQGTHIADGTLQRRHLTPDIIGSTEFDAPEVAGAGLVGLGGLLNVDLGGDAIGPGSIQVLDITADTEGTLGANRYAGSLYGPSLIDLGNRSIGPGSINRQLTNFGTVEAAHFQGSALQSVGTHLAGSFSGRERRERYVTWPQGFPDDAYHPWSEVEIRQQGTGEGDWTTGFLGKAQGGSARYYVFRDPGPDLQGTVAPPGTVYLFARRS